MTSVQVLAVLSLIGAASCRSGQVAPAGSPEEREFVGAYLAEASPTGVVRDFAITASGCS